MAGKWRTGTKMTATSGSAELAEGRLPSRVRLPLGRTGRDGRMIRVGRLSHFPIDIPQSAVYIAA